MLSICLNAGFGAYLLATVLFFAAIFFDRKAPVFLARLCLTAGLVSLTLYLLLRWQAAGRPPLSNMFESLVVFAWAIAGVGLWVDLQHKIKSVSALTSLMALLAVAYASLLDREIAPLMPALKSNWLTVHVFTCFVGYASLTVGFVSSVLLLRRKKDFQELDMISYQAIAFGFLFLTFGIISGSVWANSAWGTYWGWDPKETWSLITWLVYAAYLHLRLRGGWRGRKTAWLSVVGYLAVLFTYFGVNYLLSGLHSYA